MRRTSVTVTHPCTNRALRCLTSISRRNHHNITPHSHPLTNNHKMMVGCAEVCASYTSRVIHTPNLLRIRRGSSVLSRYIDCHCSGNHYNNQPNGRKQHIISTDMTKKSEEQSYSCINLLSPCRLREAARL